MPRAAPALSGVFLLIRSIVGFHDVGSEGNSDDHKNEEFGLWLHRVGIQAPCDHCLHAGIASSHAGPDDDWAASHGHGCFRGPSGSGRSGGRGESWPIIPAQNKSFQQHLQSISRVITARLGNVGITGCCFTVLVSHQILNQPHIHSQFQKMGRVGTVTFREGVTPWLPLRRPGSKVARGSVRALLVAC